MPPYIKITGDSISEAEKEKVVEILKNIEKENLTCQEGEAEKFQLAQYFIRLANKYISELFDDLGLTEKLNLTENHYHFLYEGLYMKRFGNLAEGCYYDKTFSIFIDYFEIFSVQPFFLFEVILHETLHAASFQHIYIKSFEEFTKNMEWQVKQSGYGQRETVGDKNITYYYGLNEMVDAGICEDIVQEKFSEIIKLLPPGDYKPTRGYSKILKETIFTGIEQKTSIDRNDIWKTFKRALFNGDTSKSFELIKSAYENDGLDVLKNFVDKTSWGDENICCPTLTTYLETNDSTKKEEAKKYIAENCSHLTNH